jgi:hypothetical protein
MDKYGFVYIWRDKGKNRYYIGRHWGTEEDRYICSSVWMRNSRKRRPWDFKRKILERVNSKEQLFLAEQKWLSLIKDNELGNRYYNLSKNHHWGVLEHSNKTKEIMSKRKIGFSPWIKGKKHTEETRLLIKEKRALQIMPPCSPEKAKKISDAQKGKPRPWQRKPRGPYKKKVKI